jgi:hypothetical protein
MGRLMLFVFMFCNVFTGMQFAVRGIGIRNPNANMPVTSACEGLRADECQL